jgi:hypothetical protein
MRAVCEKAVLASLCVVLLVAEYLAHVCFNISILLRIVALILKRTSCHTIHRFFVYMQDASSIYGSEEDEIGSQL